MNKQVMICYSGLVQGYGLRPTVMAYARQLMLCGWVRNSTAGIEIFVQGSQQQIEQLVDQIDQLLRCYDENFGYEMLDVPAAEALNNFSILPSDNSSAVKLIPPADFAICRSCRQELFDFQNRRYLFPFISCAQCGPRISIIHCLPYDRKNTAMTKYKLCAACEYEYENELDKRHFAQSTCCSTCGPLLGWYENQGRLIQQGDDCWRSAVEQLRQGAIVAVKGVGGFHLMVDASNFSAVNKLRIRKNRPAKPLAVLFKSLADAHCHVDFNAAEVAAFKSAAAPIVLAKRKPGSQLAENIAPDNPMLGAMLAYTGLQLLLLTSLGKPLIATSANRSGMPICFSKKQVLDELAGVVDFVLDFDRDIVFPQDDSVLQCIDEKPMLIRRARGFSWSVTEGTAIHPSSCHIATGSFLKNTVSFNANQRVWLSPHIGDQATEAGRQRKQFILHSMQSVLGLAEQARKSVIVSELHAEEDVLLTASRVPASKQVQHHLAHAYSLFSSENVQKPALVLAWDGVGIAPDRTIWGSEGFLFDETGGVSHVAQLLPFKLIGGPVAAGNPEYSLLSCAFACFGEQLFADEIWPCLKIDANRKALIKSVLLANYGIPCSSMGRLFDAVSCLLGLCRSVSFEGQAAMALEFACDVFALQENSLEQKSAHLFELVYVDTPQGSVSQFDWRPLFRQLVMDYQAGKSAATIARYFHEALAQWVVNLALSYPVLTIGLTGGCFQNRQLVQIIKKHLPQPIELKWSEQVPINDGGISVGQWLASTRS